MKHLPMRRQRTGAALTAGAVCLGLALTACSSSTTGAAESPSAASQDAIDEAMSTETTLTFWGWAAGMDDQIAEFEEMYPAITVDLVDVGQGTDLYTKLNAALQAGDGLPDVAQIEYQSLPSFVAVGALEDLAPYGAGDLEDLFTEGTWASVASGDAVYGIPQDSAPMFAMYRADLLEAAGLEVPTTWEEYAETAVAYHDATGDYLTDFGPTDAGQMVGILQQAGASPFTYDGGEEISIDFDTPEVQQVADYFTDLFATGAVPTDPAWTNDWFAAFADGTYASWVVGAWGPGNLWEAAADTSGSWTAAQMPQWDAATPSSGNWGGSVDAVITGSENPIAAYEFVKFLNSDPDSALDLNTDTASGLFPTTVSTLESDEFLSKTEDFFGGQEVNAVLAEAAETVNPSFDYPPFWGYARDSYNETVAVAMADGTDLYAAFQAWGDDLTQYATEQGFTVVD